MPPLCASFHVFVEGEPLLLCCSSFVFFVRMRASGGVSVSVFETLLPQKVDHDGSDCVDFEEFTVMMSAVKKGKASLGWGRINK